VVIPLATAPYRRVAERAALGRQARKAVPRSGLGVYEPATDRPDPVALLEQQATSRVPELVPIRYGRMLASPFSFLRGAALIMASDLARQPTTGLIAQLCGDAHLSNFGLFASPERQLVFDVNDFDETLPGPWEWDVKRLAASVEVAARGNGLNPVACRAVVTQAACKYRKAITEFATMTNLEVWYAHVAVDHLGEAAVGSVLGSTERKRAEKVMSKARRHDHLQAADKLTELVDGELRFVSDPPLLVPIEELLPERDADEFDRRVGRAFDEYHASLPSDRRVLLDGYQPKRLARKVVGVGSVGTRAWVVLMQGRDIGDPLLLQVKEAQASVLERFVGRSRYDNSGQRVVSGQRLMQACSDIFLGWQRMEVDGAERDFYVRQLHDWKGSADVEAMGAAELGAYGELCAWTLARAHARSGDRIALAAYLGNGTAFDDAMADFAAAYADQNEQDFAALADAVAAGRVVAERGV
jgi:uncharacterized protein (DUF2252 family)